MRRSIWDTCRPLLHHHDKKKSLDISSNSHYSHLTTPFLQYFISHALFHLLIPSWPHEFYIENKKGKNKKYYTHFVHKKYIIITLFDVYKECIIFLVRILSHTQFFLFTSQSFIVYKKITLPKNQLLVFNLTITYYIYKKITLSTT